jgi:hypothetical protein
MVSPNPQAAAHLLAIMTARDGHTDGQKDVLRVGYALREKRIASLISPELQERGRTRGLTFVRIDPDCSLEEQGPFDLILHKIEVCLLQSVNCYPPSLCFPPPLSPSPFVPLHLHGVLSAVRMS